MCEFRFVPLGVNLKPEPGEEPWTGGEHAGILGSGKILGSVLGLRGCCTSIGRGLAHPKQLWGFELKLCWINPSLGADPGGWGLLLSPSGATRVLWVWKIFLVNIENIPGE